MKEIIQRMQAWQQRRRSVLEAAQKCENQQLFDAHAHMKVLVAWEEAQQMYLREITDSYSRSEFVFARYHSDSSISAQGKLKHNDAGSPSVSQAGNMMALYVEHIAPNGHGTAGRAGTGGRVEGPGEERRCHKCRQVGYFARNVHTNVLLSRRKIKLCLTPTNAFIPRFLPLFQEIRDGLCCGLPLDSSAILSHILNYSNKY